MSAVDVVARGLAARGLAANNIVTSGPDATVQQALDGYVTRAEIKALSASEGARAYLVEAGREGAFVFRSAVPQERIVADTLEGLYLVPDGDPSGANGAWSRIYDGTARPEWFGAVADFDWDTESGTDSAPAINACIALTGGAFLAGDYCALSPIELFNVGDCLVTAGAETAQVFAIAGFNGDAVVRLHESRCYARGVVAWVLSEVYDPATQVGTPIDCFVTTGSVYHQYLVDCRAVGGRRGFSLGALEGKLRGCHADSNFDGYYVENFDNYLNNVTAKDSVNYGIHSECGLEGNNLHMVRSGQAALSLFNQVPVMLDGVFIDTPARAGINLKQTNGAIINSIYFTKMGENRSFDGGASIGSGTTPDYDCNYFSFTNSRHNVLRGGYIAVQNTTTTIDRGGHYFVNFADSADDTLRSIENRFENFDTADVVIAKNAGQRDSMQANKVIDCHGTLSKYDNEGLLWRSDQTTSIAAGAGFSAKMWLSPEINSTHGSRFAMIGGEWLARGSATNRAAGKFLVPIVNPSDSGSKDGVFTATYANGTAPSLTLTNVAYNAATRVLTFDVTNTGASGITLGMAARMPTENLGLA
ncbi:hypothetical protein GRI89_14535 [Altererythrobacter salegens]|uniref:Uncharacterized protein n=1 Tax=Croceibacterium salegens TaxID=1737568 RepID=A0A6I4T0H0_9SPHN|nr:hypothetical protein [Croceibacterium salegens]MXO60757.1 hypothetical protein [Croceibacterium salegens]